MVRIVSFACFLMGAFVLWGCSNSRLSYSAPAPVVDVSPEVGVKKKKEAPPKKGIDHPSRSEQAKSTKDNNSFIPVSSKDKSSSATLVSSPKKNANTTPNVKTKTESKNTYLIGGVGKPPKNEDSEPKNGVLAKVEQKKVARTHVVQSGENLYRIAAIYQVPQTQIVELNHLDKGSVKVGQKLLIDPVEKVAYTSASGGVRVPPISTTLSQNASTANRIKPDKPASQAQASIAPPEDLMWPHTGGPDTLFGKNGSKGISILGQEGDAVAAVASGKVLYAGSSLKGYGNLLIIKHGDKWLSAYAHNKSLMVKEGATVKKGQVIALMGRVEAPRVMLHFELRYQGRPVDPLLYLPKR